MLDWAALVVVLIGRLLVARRSMLAFPLFVIADLLWALWAILWGPLSLLIANLVFLVADLYGWRRWVKHGR
jgi:hypothetical protein